MTAPTPDALESALPAGIDYTPDLLEVWHARKIAQFQAERLAEAGYVLVHTAPDGATVERLAPAVHNAYLETAERLGWPVKPENLVPYSQLSDDSKELDRATVRAVLNVLAALAGTSAQAGHTADDATGDA